PVLRDAGSGSTPPASHSAPLADRLVRDAASRSSDPVGSDSAASSGLRDAGSGSSQTVSPAPLASSGLGDAASGSSQTVSPGPLASDAASGSSQTVGSAPLVVTFWDLLGATPQARFGLVAIGVGMVAVL